ncbi:MAG: hypothetical protein ABI647_24655, partial [Gemmatimonadota bacterium]
PAGGDPPTTAAATDGSISLAQGAAAAGVLIACQAAQAATEAATAPAGVDMSKLVPIGTDQGKQAAGSAPGQRGDESSGKLADVLADQLAPPLEGAQVISADAAGDQGTGTAKREHDAGSPRREHAGAGDPIPVVRIDDLGLPQVPMTARPNAATPSFAGGPADPVDVAAPVAEPAVAGMGRRDQVIVQLADDLGRIRVSVRGETVRATIMPNDGALATRLTAEARSLERSLSEQGFRDARVSVQAPRPAADAAPIWNQAAKASPAVDNMKAQAGSRSQDEAAHDSREGERRDDPRTRDQRGQRGQRARQQKEKEPQQ